ncbi:putative Chymotrypsinogen B2 [Hypsibius exemplaris]|uniref:Chymotrypsinogen B2 n=1 Tax=Hypsibius exemplaris TaxID=2072580 RepID=A0A1W0WIU9_HYPEX|nr:putative Chymotrypsinogen B2 [Hypsibius exemplaris]
MKLSRRLVTVFMCLFAAKALFCEDSIENGEDNDLDSITEDNEKELVVRDSVDPTVPDGDAVGPAQALIGGFPVAPHKYRFMVSLQLQKNRFHLCGGVLISSTHVLTTSVCVFGLNTFDIIVGVGLHNRKTNDSQHFFKVKSIQLHRLYNSTQGSFENDIALLTLAAPITSQPTIKAGIIALPRNINEDYHKPSAAAFRLVGWGATKNPRPGQEIVLPLLLQGALVRVLSAAQCSTRAKERMKASKICIDSGRTAVCMGDSGGPLFRQRASGEYELVGLGSYVVGNCQAINGANVFTKVAYFLPWIEKAVAANRQVNPPRVPPPPSVAFNECARTNGIAPFVINGKNATKHQLNWIVSIQSPNSYDVLTHICGGSIISDRLILTAAHCLYYLNSNDRYGTDQLKIKFGSHNPHDSPAIGISNIQIHPKYHNQNPSTHLHHDIAILTLKHAIGIDNKKVGLISLPSPGKKVCTGDEDLAWIAGWGHTNSTKDPVDQLYLTPPKILQYARVERISRATCRGIYPTLNFSQYMMCTSSTGTDACQGDSGGALFEKYLVRDTTTGETKTKHRILGIISGSSRGCGIAGKASIFTEVAGYVRSMIAPAIDKCRTKC